MGPGASRVYPGSSVPGFDLHRDMPQIDPGSVLAGDVDRFARLSEGYVVADPGRDGVLTDIRYSMLPNAVTPMWGLDLEATTQSGHAAFEVYRDRPQNARELFMAMLLGRDLPD